ncbi:MAG: putative Nucleotidyltransferase domain protein [Promethearchaeota archaeon]|jgi:hypothetical protein|nr:MAG: putative Nucleotidyltransferase domain protein [Candidatus Lokiarchaeota archaeon]
MSTDKSFSKVPRLFRNYVSSFFQFLKDKLRGEILSVILYGSIARKNWKRESDVDLLLIVSNKFIEKYESSKISQLTIHFYNEIFGSELYDMMKFHPLSILTLTKKQTKRFRTLFYDIAMDGIILYDPKNIGSKLIEKYKKRIKNKGLKRIYVENDNFYWKRKDVKTGEIIEL